MATSFVENPVLTSSSCSFFNINIDENQESITIIWFDTKISTRDIKYESNIKQRLREINDYVLFFSNQEECITYIQSIQYEKILLITSGECASDFLPKISSLKQIDSIFIFCFKKKHYSHLENQFPKIVGVFVDLELLLNAIKETVADINSQLQEFAILDRYQQSARDLSKRSAEFLWFQLSKDVIMRLPRSEPSRTQMLDVCRQYYRDNPRELARIDQFERSYEPDDVIRWYTKQSFVYKLINKALRCEDIDQLLRFRFFIVDLSTRLVSEHKKLLESDIQTLTVYRGTRLHQLEVERFRRNVGHFIATNGFWSTSRNRGRALLFTSKSTQRNDTLRVLFEITCDVKGLAQNAIFSDIAEFSEHPNEQEVLFDLSTCFRIDSVQEINNGDIWEIKLSVSDDGQNIAQTYFKEKRNEIENRNVELMLGILMCEMGQYKKSQKYFEQLLNDPQGIDISWIELNIGRALYYQGELTQARIYYNKTYERMMNEKPQRIKDSATVLNNIGVILQDQGNHDKAQVFHQDALEIRENLLPADHLDMTCSLTNIGNVLHEQGKYDAALELHTKALNMHEKFRSSNHFDCAISLNNIGNILADQGKYNEAQQYHQRVLKLRQSILTSEHPDIADSYNNIGYMLYKQGKYNEALEFHHKARKIREKCLPTDHPKIADSLNNIGSVFQSQKKDKEAIDYYRRALIMREKCLPTIHSDIAYSLNNIGNILCKQGNYIEALESCAKALEIQEKCRTPNHPDIAACHNNIGAILQNQGNNDGALFYFQRAHKMRRQYLPENHPDIADSLNNIGLIQQKQQNYIESLNLYRQSIAIKGKYLPQDHPSMAISFHNIANILRLQGNYSECLDYYIRAHKIQETYLPSNDLEMADNLYYMGLTYEKLYQPARALENLKQANEIYRNLPDEGARRNRIERHIQRLSVG